MKQLHLTLIALVLSFASFAITGPITGVNNTCVGMTTPLSDTTAGGAWSSSNVAVASVDPSSGLVMGNTAGTAIISYAASSGLSTLVFTVYPLPSVITGPSVVCAGSTITLTDVTPGGTWSTDAPGVLTIDPATGVATGIAGGTANVRYTSSTSCTVTHPVMVNPTPVISGAVSICTSTSVPFTASIAGGTWSTSSSGVATVDPASGVVFGVAPGVAIIYYTLSTGCSSGFTTTVNSTPFAGPISGPSIVCTSNTITLTGFTPGGTWSSSNPAVGSISTTGMLTGLTVGTTTVSYTLSAACGSGMATLVVNVDTISSAGTISGIESLCEGSTSFLTSTVAGGTWTTADASIATISSSGVVTGIAAGTTNVTYTVTLGCGTSFAVSTVTINPLATISFIGSTSLCVGASVTLNPMPAGGTWSASSSIISIDASSGSAIVTGLSSGGATVSYFTTFGCLTTTPITVIPPPTAGTLSGPTSVCVGGTVSLTTSVSGGTWSVTNPHATISSSGVITGITAGLDTVVYTVASPCGVATVTWGINVTTTVSAGSITGPTSVCIGLSASLSDVVTGGTWYSSSPGIASINPTTGVYTGVSSGTAVITYTVTASCGTASTNTIVTVTPVAGTITGTASLCPGAITTLMSSISGGSWHVNPDSVATINATTGVLTAIEPGTATVTYMVVTGCSVIRTITVNPLPVITTTLTHAVCGGTYTAVAAGGISYVWSPASGLSCSICTTTVITPASTHIYTVTGTDANGCKNTATDTVINNRIYGHVHYPGAVPSSLSSKVWLIHYNPADSAVIDSTTQTTCLDAGEPYFEFDNKAAGSYVVRAALLSAVPGTSDYVPTYASSSISWFSASNVAHTTSSDNINVTMIYGTMPAGVGTISGNIYIDSPGTTPAPYMLVFLRNAFTFAVITHTYTDASGAYSFTGLGTGNYVVYPEAFRYYTTPSATINLGSPYTSYPGINFRQRTTARTIKPYSPTGIEEVTAAGNVSIFPNPTTGVLNVQWDAIAAGTAQVIVTDILGRQVFTAAIDISSATRTAQTDLSSLKKGMYFISIRSGQVSYSSKLIIE